MGLDPVGRRVVHPRCPFLRRVCSTCDHVAQRGGHRHGDSIPDLNVPVATQPMEWSTREMWHTAFNLVRVRDHLGCCQQLNHGPALRTGLADWLPECRLATSFLDHSIPYCAVSPINLETTGVQRYAAHILLYFLHISSSTYRTSVSFHWVQNTDLGESSHSPNTLFTSMYIVFTGPYHPVISMFKLMREGTTCAVGLDHFLFDVLLEFVVVRKALNPRHLAD